MEDSLKLYKKYFLESKNPQLSTDKKISMINGVVFAVYSELSASPFEFQNSPFIMEIKKIIAERNANKVFSTNWFGKDITLPDAYAIINHVKKSFVNKKYERFLEDQNSKFFFKDSIYTVENEFIADIEQNLRTLEQYLSVRKNQSATIKSVAPVKIPVNTAEKNVFQNYAGETNAEIEFQKHIADSEAERAKQLEIRREDNQQAISAWHDEQAKLAKSISDLQMPAQELLKDLRSFSDKLTENYIIRFAETQIELFNLISGNLAYHESRAENSYNQDYYNAVQNYKTYLEMIIDALAKFGIEEISSNAGTHFDGEIHNVTNTNNFSPAIATVRISLRSGFRYGDLILQKENVEV